MTTPSTCKLATLLLFCSSIPAAAQTAILREDDPSPDGVAGQTISSIVVPAVNQTGGFACSLTTLGPNGTVNQIWGNVSGGTGALLQTERTIGLFEFTGIEGFFGISETSVIYSPVFTDNGTAQTNLDGLWIDDTSFARETQQLTTSSDRWRFLSRPGMTQNGTPYFSGGLEVGLSGNTDRRGIFIGNVPAPIFITGVTYPNMPLPLSTTAIDSDFRFSSDGSHLITALDLDSSIDDDGVVGLDGAGLVLGGSLVREAGPVPASIGGVAENWDNFDFFGITNSGEYMFTGDTDGASTEDEFILRNGTMWHREGDTLDGVVLSGPISSASLNEAGELAYVWGYEVGTGAPDEALFFEEQLLLAEGDAVDWDGDGQVDPLITIVDFTGINALSLSAGGTIYFTADVIANGARREGLFAISAEGIGTNYCTANVNSTGDAGQLRAVGSGAAASNNLTLRATSLPVLSFGFGIVSGLQGFVANPGGSQGNLCLSGDIGRYVGPGQIMNTGLDGIIILPLDLTNIPQPLGFEGTSAGDTWNFQVWFRDSSPAGPSSNFTQGLSITFD